MKNKTYKAKIIREKKANDKKQIEIYDILYERAMSEFRDKAKDFLYRVNDSIFRDVIITSGKYRCGFIEYLKHYRDSVGESTTTNVQIADYVLNINDLRKRYIERRIKTLSANVLASLKDQ